MPMGPYKDFDMCVMDQMKKHHGEEGFTMENARKICGAIKARTENKMSEVTVIEHKSDSVTIET